MGSLLSLHPKLKPPEGQRGRSLLNCPVDQVQRAATRVTWKTSLGHGGLVLETKTSSVSTELCLSQGACLPGLLFLPYTASGGKSPHPPTPAPGLKLCGLASLSPQSVFLTAVSHDTGPGHMVTLSCSHWFLTRIACNSFRASFGTLSLWAEVRRWRESSDTSLSKEAGHCF